MVTPQIVITLSAKRAEIEGHIAKLRRQLATAERDLSAVTAVLALCERRPAKQTRFPAHANLNRLFVSGEMFRLCKWAIEEAGKSLTTREIASANIRAKGWAEEDVMLKKALAYRPI